MNERKITSAKELKLYAANYDRVFGVPGKSVALKTFNYENIAGGDHFKNADALANAFREEIIGFEHRLFDLCVKFTWLTCQYSYKGKKRALMSSTGHTIGHTFAYFMRRFVGVETRHWSRLNFFSRIRSYFPDLFPYFELGNPIKDPEQYKFPYKHVTLGHMLAVSRLKNERMALLDKAEREKMPYADFLDYVFNYCYSRNDDLGRDRYGMAVSVYSGPFAYDIDLSNKKNPKPDGDAQRGAKA